MNENISASFCTSIKKNIGSNAGTQPYEVQGKVPRVEIKWPDIP